MPLPPQKLEFNVAGPCIPGEHYMLPPLDRLPGIMQLVETRKYFVLHAPRQSGKTTAIRALVRDLNATGRMTALYFSLEATQAFTEPEVGLERMVGNMVSDLLDHPVFGPAVAPFDPVKTSRVPRPKRFLSLLTRTAAPKPLVVFFDEVDALADGTLITFLRELRDGYVNRDETPFPVSVALVSMRNIRDYKARIRPETQTMGSASPFNIITEALTLSTFSEKDIRTLYGQHTAATGQAFTDEAVSTAYALTRGQPWLVNALARECVEKIHERRYAEPITGGDMEAAKETLIRKRPVHLDYLLWMAQSEICQTATSAVLLGRPIAECRSEDGIRLLKELGLVSETDGKLAFANPLYAEAFAMDCPQTPNVQKCPQMQITM